MVRGRRGKKFKKKGDVGMGTRGGGGEQHNVGEYCTLSMTGSTSARIGQLDLDVRMRSRCPRFCEIWLGY